MAFNGKRIIVAAAVTALFLMLGLWICSGKAYAAESYTYDLNNGVSIITNKDLDKPIANPDVGDAAQYIHVKIHGVAAGDTADLKNTTHCDGTQSWTLERDNDTIDIPIEYYGKYTLTITAGGDSASRKIWIIPKRPSKIKVITTSNIINFNTSSASPYRFGPYSWVNICDATGNCIDSYKIKNQMDSVSITPEGVKPGTRYTLYIWGWDPDLDDESGNFVSATYVKKTVVMGPSTAPVIKSVKFSKAKVSKVKSSGHWKDGQWAYNYKTSWTATITLKTKAKGIKGIVVSDGIDGQYLCKGNKSKYKVKMSRTGEGFNHKGKVLGIMVRTYSDNTCAAYSSWSNVKNVKIK